jgi:hypothetical protein
MATVGRVQPNRPQKKSKSSALGAGSERSGEMRERAAAPLWLPEEKGETKR